MFIQDAQRDDSGVYICQAQVGSEVVRDNVTLTVGGKFRIFLTIFWNFFSNTCRRRNINKNCVALHTI